MKAFALLIVTVLTSVASAQPAGWPAEVEVNIPASWGLGTSAVLTWDEEWSMYFGDDGVGDYSIEDGWFYVYDPVAEDGADFTTSSYAAGFPPTGWSGVFGNVDRFAESPSFRVPEPASLSLLVAGLLVMYSRSAKH